MANTFTPVLLDNPTRGTTTLLASCVPPSTSDQINAGTTPGDDTGTPGFNFSRFLKQWAADTNANMQAIANFIAVTSGGFAYQGVWNASTNTPTLASGQGVVNYVYKVSVAGSTTLDGNNVWNVGDFAFFDGTTWDKLSGGAFTTINNLPAGTALTGTEDVAIYQGGQTVQVPSSYFASYINPVLGLVANSISAASANSTLINNALVAGGVVNISGAGTYYHSGIIAQSNSTLILGPYTKLVLAPSSTGPALITQSAVTFLNGGSTLTGGTSVTLAQATESGVTVTWASHGQTVNNVIWLAGNSVGVYNGLFRVAAVIDANTLTVYTLRYSATAPGTGSKAVQAVQNFNLIGGTWDYSGANQSTTGYQQSGIVLAGIADSTVDSVLSINSLKNGVQINAALNVRCSNVKVYQPQSNTQGIVVYGPANSIKIDGISGLTSGPLVAIQTNVSDAHQFTAPGDVFDVTVNNVSGIALATYGIQITCSDNEILEAIHFDQVNCQDVAAAVVNLARGTGFSVGNVGRLYFRNMQIPSQTASSPMIHIGACTFDAITIEDSTLVPGSTASAAGNNMISLDTAAIGNQLILNRVKVSGWPSTSGTTILIYVNNAQVKNYRFRDCQALGATGAIHWLYFGSASNTVQDILIDGGFYDASISEMVYFPVALASGTPNIISRGVNFNGCSYVIRNGAGVQNYHARFDGCTLTVATAVVATAVSNTVKLSSDGTNDLTTGSWIGVTAGTPQFSLFGYDITFDVTSAYINQGVAGQFANSTTSGTGKAGLAVKVNTGSTNTWYALATGASGANTLIV